MNNDKRVSAGIRTGGQFDTHDRTDASVALVPTPADVSPVAASDIKRGDAIAIELSPGEWARTGIVSSISEWDNDRVRIHMHDGSGLVADLTSTVHTLPGLHLSYRRENSYEDNLAAAYSANASEAVLGDILHGEAEDDFLRAVAGHPNASEDQIEQASQHHSSWVREAAVENPGASIRTLMRIRDEADENAAEAAVELKMAGRNPQSTHTEWIISTNRTLSANAASRIYDYLTE